MNKKNNQKGFVVPVLLAIIVVLIIGGSVYVYQNKNKKEEAPAFVDTGTQQTDQVQQQTNTQTQQPSTSLPGMPFISADKKSIVADGKILLSIDNERIMSGFRSNNPWLCEMNQDWTKEMRPLCNNKTFFKEKSVFTSISVSPDKVIAFNLDVKRSVPSTYGNEFLQEVGIFSISTNKVNLLESSGSNTKFISFSPSGKNFVYRTGCFEGFSSLCDLFIKDSETFTTKASLMYKEGMTTNKFIRWISDNQVEYEQTTIQNRKEVSELKQKSF